MKKIYTIRDADRQRAHLWEGHRIEDEVSACSHRSIAQIFLDQLPKNEEILEAGCGLGAWVVFLSEKGYNIAGIDNNNAVIDQLKTWNSSLKVQHGDIERLPYDDNAIGAYISLGVVEHFEEGPESPLQEAFRVLKPGGMLILTVPANNLFRRLIAHPLRQLYLRYHEMHGRNRYFAEYRYSASEVTQMVTKAGFVVHKTGTDDFISKRQSLTLWSEFPFLRSKQPYSLNIIGGTFAWIMNTISPKILTAGILVIARKPPASAASVAPEGFSKRV